jgi:hypothetical protein
VFHSDGLLSFILASGVTEHAEQLWGTIDEPSNDKGDLRDATAQNLITFIAYM